MRYFLERFDIGGGATSQGIYIQPLSANTKVSKILSTPPTMVIFHETSETTRVFLLTRFN